MSTMDFIVTKVFLKQWNHLKNKTIYRVSLKVCKTQSIKLYSVFVTGYSALINESNNRHLIICRKTYITLNSVSTFLDDFNFPMKPPYSFKTSANLYTIRQNAISQKTGQSRFEELKHRSIQISRDRPKGFQSY